MGFRYALLTTQSDRDAVLGAIQANLVDGALEEVGNTTVCLPDKVEPGRITLAKLPDCLAVVLPFQLVSLASYDLSRIAAMLDGEITAIGQDDTTGETWLQRFDNGELVFAYHCGDGEVVMSVGNHPQKEPSEWSEFDLFEILPESMRLGRDGESCLDGQEFLYAEESGDGEKDGGKSRSWWKLWS